MAYREHIRLATTHLQRLLPLQHPLLSYMHFPVGKGSKPILNRESPPEPAAGEMYVSAYTLRVGVLDVREYIRRKKSEFSFIFKYNSPIITQHGSQLKHCFG